MYEVLWGSERLNQKVTKNTTNREGHNVAAQLTQCGV